MSVSEIIEKVCEIALDAGKIMTGAHDVSIETEKSGRANFVTHYDLEVQNFLYDRLSKLVPGVNLIGEESSSNHAELLPKGYSFIIDPIDGTTNFLTGVGHSTTSIALCDRGEVVGGVVYDPYGGELFHAVKGEGAWLNERRIHTGDNRLCDSLILFGTSPYRRELTDRSFEIAHALFDKARDLRRSGSAALDLCSIAAGRGDLFFELQLMPWDYAAGMLIASEAGAIVTTMERTAPSLAVPSSVLAANPFAYEDYFDCVGE